MTTIQIPMPATRTKGHASKAARETYGGIMFGIAFLTGSSREWAAAPRLAQEPTEPSDPDEPDEGPGERGEPDEGPGERGEPDEGPRESWGKTR